MKLIVGLGNPGGKYKNNRHNVGTMFVDYFAQRISHNTQRFEKDSSLHSFITALRATRYALHEDIILSKPQTYMNKSGKAVASCVTRYTLRVTHDLIIVHDDLDIPFGKFRIVKGYGPKLHNGIESIESSLKTKDFLRIRIGVDARSPENRTPGIEYVLQDFSPDQQSKLSPIFNQIITQLKSDQLPTLR